MLSVDFYYDNKGALFLHRSMIQQVHGLWALYRGRRAGYQTYVLIYAMTINKTTQFFGKGVLWNGTTENNNNHGYKGSHDLDCTSMGQWYVDDCRLAYRSMHSIKRREIGDWNSKPTFMESSSLILFAATFTTFSRRPLEMGSKYVQYTLFDAKSHTLGKEVTERGNDIIIYWMENCMPRIRRKLCTFVWIIALISEFLLVGLWDYHHTGKSSEGRLSLLKRNRCMFLLVIDTPVDGMTDYKRIPLMIMKFLRQRMAGQLTLVFQQLVSL